MANDIETTTTADIIFSPSEGETLNDYLACLADSLSTLPDNDDVKKILSSGNPITLLIKGMPEIKKEEEAFDMEEYLENKVAAFAEENPELVTRLGTAALRDVVYGFFENLTETSIKSAPPTEKVLSPLAARIVKSVGI
jgi:hypothetical protein